MSTRKWRPSWHGGEQKRRGYEVVYHIVASAYRAVGRCGVDLYLVNSQLEGETIPARMCKRCRALKEAK